MDSATTTTWNLADTQMKSSILHDDPSCPGSTDSPRIAAVRGDVLADDTEIQPSTPADGSDVPIVVASAVQKKKTALLGAPVVMSTDLGKSKGYQLLAGWRKTMRLMCVRTVGLNTSEELSAAEMARASELVDASEELSSPEVAHQSSRLLPDEPADTAGTHCGSSTVQPPQAPKDLQPKLTTLLQPWLTIRHKLKHMADSFAAAARHRSDLRRCKRCLLRWYLLDVKADRFVGWKGGGQVMLGATHNKGSHSVTWLCDIKTVKGKMLTGLLLKMRGIRDMSPQGLKGFTCDERMDNHESLLTEIRWHLLLKGVPRILPLEAVVVGNSTARYRDEPYAIEAFAVPFVAGQTLDEFLKDERIFANDPDVRFGSLLGYVSFLKLLVGTLVILHEKYEVMHGGICPHNIMVTMHERRIRPILVGLTNMAYNTSDPYKGCKLAEHYPRYTKFGDWPERAPELYKHYSRKCRGRYEIGFPAEMWAVGLMMWYMATGIRPFNNTAPSKAATVACTEEVLQAWAENDQEFYLVNLADYVPNTPEWQAYAAIVNSLLQNNPEDRPTARQLLTALRTSFPPAANSC